MNNDVGCPLLASFALQFGGYLTPKINTNDYEQNKEEETQRQELQDTPRNYGYVRSTQGRFRRATRDTN